MPTTSNFGWTTPADTDLVKDGAAAIRTLGNGIDTSFLDLKGGTTDQVLAKNSNTDLDFKWVTSDDANAIQNAIVDAKGDLISATAADTPARLAVGANDTVLTADSSTATGLKWAAPSTGALVVVKAETTFSAVSEFIADNVFSSTYSDYVLIMRWNSSSTGLLNVNFRASASNTTTNYQVQVTEAGGSGGTTALGTSYVTSPYIAHAINNATDYGALRLHIFSPQKAEVTNFHSDALVPNGAYSTPKITQMYGVQNSSTQFDGIRIFPGNGNITGRYTIYGVSK